MGDEMKLFSFILIGAVIIAMGCSGGPRLNSRSSNQISNPNRNNNLLTNSGAIYSSAKYIFADQNESISITVSQVGYRILLGKDRISSSKTEFSFLMDFKIDISNNSSEYTFNGFNIGNWYLYDDNDRIWSLIDTDKGKIPNELDNCGPGRKKSYLLTYASGDYDNTDDLPDKLKMKIVGGFSPNIFVKKFNEELIFNKN